MSIYKIRKNNISCGMKILFKRKDDTVFKEKILLDKESCRFIIKAHDPKKPFHNL